MIKLLFLPQTGDYTTDQWFSTGVPWNPWVPQKALGVPPISEFNWYLLVKCSKGCRQIVKKQRKGAANQKRLRNTPQIFPDFTFAGGG